VTKRRSEAGTQGKAKAVPMGRAIRWTEAENEEAGVFTDEDVQRIIDKWNEDSRLKGLLEARPIDPLTGAPDDAPAG